MSGSEIFSPKNFLELVLGTFGRKGGNPAFDFWPGTDPFHIIPEENNKVRKVLQYKKVWHSQLQQNSHHLICPHHWPNPSNMLLAFFVIMPGQYTIEKSEGTTLSIKTNSFVWYKFQNLSRNFFSFSHPIFVTNFSSLSCCGCRNDYQTMATKRAKSGECVVLLLVLLLFDSANKLTSASLFALPVKRIFLSIF